MTTYAIRLIYITLITIFTYNITYENTSGASKLLTFDDLKHFISFYESSNGKYKFNKTNKNGTVDCGIYQINSAHFVTPRSRTDTIARGFDSIFTSYKVSSKLNSRIVETVRNDALCESLAKYLYYQKGISEWAVYPKFKEYIVGYRYNVGKFSMSTLQSKSNGDRRKSNQGKFQNCTWSTDTKVLRHNATSAIRHTSLNRKSYGTNRLKVLSKD